MSLTIHLRVFIGIAVLMLNVSASAAEYTEGALGYDWNPETKQFKRVFKEWQEGITLDSASGNYVVTYKDGHGEYNEVIFEPATKIDPSVRSKIDYNGTRKKFLYEYKVKNGAKAKQDIDTLIALVSNVSSSAGAPVHWEGSVVPTFADPNLRVVWIPQTAAKGLPPKKSADGFKIESNDLPGVAIMQIKGDAKPTTWLGHSPDIATPVGKQVAALEASDFVSRIVAVPKIPVPSSYNTAAVLTGIQKHIQEDMVSLHVIDSTFAAQLDRSLQAALDAAKINNLVGVKQNLHDLRKALKKAHNDVDEDGNNDDEAEHEDPKQKPKPVLINKLAARVLDFDVKYVLRRLEKAAEE